MVVCIGFPFRAVAVSYGVAVCDVTSCTYCLFGASCSTATMCCFVELFFASRTFMPMVFSIGRPNVLCLVSKRIEDSPSFKVGYFNTALCILVILSTFTMVICALACGSAIRFYLWNKSRITYVRNGINLKFNGNGCVSCYVVKCV